MTIQVTNRSDAFLSFWNVSAAVYGGSGTFLANGMTIGSNLRPHASAIEKILLGNVDASRVASWKLSLGTITAQKETGDELPDTEKYFTLQEAK